MILKLPVPLFLSVLFIIASQPGFAQWQRTPGPEGGVISAIVSDGGTLYAATGVAVSSGLSSSGDLYESTNLGTTWISIGADIPENTPIYCLGINSKSLYCGTAAGLFRRSKTGMNWDSIGPLTGEYRIVQLLVSDTEILAYGQFTGMYRSTDDGNTWTKLNLGNIKSATINAIDRSGNDLYVATQGQGILFSSDNGATWQQRNGQIVGDNLYVASLYHLKGAEFAGTLRGAFRTSDQGMHWDSARAGLPSEFGPSSFTSESDSADVLYAAVSSMGIYFSTDLGTNWTAMNSGIPEYSPTSGLAFCSNHLFTGVSVFGIMRAAADTKTWEPATTGISNTSVQGMLVTGNTLFAGASDNDFGLAWKSSDHGATWKQVDSMSDRGINCFAESGGRIFAGTFGDGIYVSADNGVTWKSRELEVPGASYVNAFAVTPQAVIGAISGTVGIVRSTDLGETWSSPLASASAFINTVYYDSLTHTVFAGSNFGFFISTDEGASWQRPTTSIDSVSIYSFARIGNVLLAGSWFGVYRSADNGNTWSLADQSTAKVKFLALETIGTDVFAGIKGDVLISHDQGSHWQSFQSGLPRYADAPSLAWDGTYLYSGTSGYGVWKTPLQVSAVRGEIAKASTTVSVRYRGTEPVVHYTLSSPAFVSIRLISVEGETLLEQSDELAAGGDHELILPETLANSLPAGMYFVEIRSGGTIERAKILLSK